MKTFARICNIVLLGLLFLTGVLSFFEYLTFDDWKPVYKFIGTLKKAGFERGFFGILGITLFATTAAVFFAWVLRRKEISGVHFEKKHGKLTVNYSAIKSLMEFCAKRDPQTCDAEARVERGMHGLVLRLFLTVYPMENQVEFMERLQQEILERLNEVFSVKGIARIDIQVRRILVTKE